MKFFEKSHTYEYDWETATSAWWDKYPNPDQPQVRHWDTLYRNLDRTSGILTVHRLFWIEYSLPKWVHTVFRTTSMDGYGTEVVTCDVQKKRLVMRGRNYTFRNLIEIEETCTYQEHPSNPNWTEFIHRSEFRVGKMGLLNSKLEESARDSAFGKSNVGVHVMERLIQSLHLSEWKEKADHWRKHLDDIGHERLEKGKEILRNVEREAKDLYDKVKSSSEYPKK
jgi:4-amino-4-deoxychorismate lyase